MKYLLLLVLTFGIVLPSPAAEKKKKTVEEMPETMFLQYQWAAAAKADTERLKRFETFWKNHLPKNPDEYEDQPHITHVRLAGYRLAALYAQFGQVAKCQEKLKWLEANDDTIPK